MQQQIDSGMNLYDMNKQIMEKTGKPMSVYAVNQTLRSVVKPFLLKTKKELQPRYFMMLCHEKRDYTLFRLDWFSNDCIDNAIGILKECMQNRGILYAINMDEHDTAVELWLKINDEFNCYLLFPYDEGVIEV